MRGITVLTEHGPVREIQGFLAEQYGTEVSPEFISTVTDEVMAEVAAWQNRPLEPLYPVIFFDALQGLAEALETAFPRTAVQTCIVNLTRSSLDYTSYKERKPVAAALRPIYTAPTAEAALEALAYFEAEPCGRKHPMIVRSWRRAWEHVIPFCAFPPEVRRIISTTNAIESLHRQLRKIIKTRGHFPGDEAALKLLWLALRNIFADKVRSAYDWKAAMNQFAVMYGERFTGKAASGSSCRRMANSSSLPGMSHTAHVPVAAPHGPPSAVTTPQPEGRTRSRFARTM